MSSYCVSAIPGTALLFAVSAYAGTQVYLHIVLPLANLAAMGLAQH
jgi:hypothetical protein